MNTYLRRVATVGCLLLAVGAAAPTAQAQPSDGGAPFSGIAGTGVSLADRPNITPQVVDQFISLANDDPELVNYLFDTLDKLSDQDASSGEIIKDVIVKPYGGNKRLASYIVKLSKEVYKKDPQAAKILIDKLLESHAKHDLISDSLAKELAELSRAIPKQ